MNNFANNLRKIRRIKDLTQKDLSRITGIHQTHISHFERGRRKPSFRNLKKILDALDCKAEDLIKQ